MIYLIETGEETPTVCITKNDVFQQIKDDDMISKIWESEWEQTTSIIQTFRDVSEDMAREYFNDSSDSFSEYDLVPDFILNNVDEDYIRNILNDQGRSDFEEHNTLNHAQQGV